MQQGEIRQLLRKQDGGRIDSYLLKNRKRKEVQYDLMNLLQTWTHCLLYYKKVYPHDAFVQRNILGIKVYVASSTVLKNYLDEFFGKLRNHKDHLNHFQILILTTNGQILEVNTLHIQNQEEQTLIEEENEQKMKNQHKIQKDIQFKSFLFDLKERLQTGFIRGEEEVTFKFRVGYRMESLQEKSQTQLVQDWVKRQKIEGKGNILMSLKAHSLNIIYERCN